MENTFALVYCYDDQGGGALFSDYKVKRDIWESSTFDDCETAHENAMQYETETVSAAWILEDIGDCGCKYTKIA